MRQVTHRETVRDLAELTGAAITTRGVFVPAGRQPPPGERKLHLLIQVRKPPLPPARGQLPCSWVRAGHCFAKCPFT